MRVRDSTETVTSLSDRFGLEIPFSVPDKDEYLYIVDQLATENGSALSGEQLHLLARALRAAPERALPARRASSSASSSRSNTKSNRTQKKHRKARIKQKTGRRRACFIKKPRTSASAFIPVWSRLRAALRSFGRIRGRAAVASHLTEIRMRSVRYVTSRRTETGFGNTANHHPAGSARPAQPDPSPSVSCASISVIVTLSRLPVEMR